MKEQGADSMNWQNLVLERGEREREGKRFRVGFGLDVSVRLVPSASSGTVEGRAGFDEAG